MGAFFLGGDLYWNWTSDLLIWSQSRYHYANRSYISGGCFDHPTFGSARVWVPKHSNRMSPTRFHCVILIPWRFFPLRDEVHLQPLSSTWIEQVTYGATIRRSTTELWRDTVYIEQNYFKKTQLPRYPIKIVSTISSEKVMKIPKFTGTWQTIENVLDKAVILFVTVTVNKTIPSNIW